MNLGGWVFFGVGSDVHVSPLDDLRPHDVPTCWCCPERRGECDNVVVHHALDQRELYEDAERRLS
jgi:hypothetical protein